MNEMKVFVITKGERIDTLKRLIAAGVQSTVITHDKSCVESLLYLLQDCPGELVKFITTGERGALSSRNFLLSLVKDNEWYCSLDDDLEDVTMVHPPFYGQDKLPVEGKPPKGYKSWRQVYGKKIGYAAMLRHLHSVQKLCEEKGATLGGIAKMENPYFRARKYSYFKNIGTGLHIAKRAGMREIKGGEYAHDQWQSAYKIAQDGCIVLNNFVRIHTKVFGDPETGLGTLAHRRKDLEKHLSLIEKEFQGLVRPGKFPNLHIALRSQETIAKWRRQRGKSEKVKHVLGAEQSRAHHCHWPGCKVQIPPAAWGCIMHWKMLPKDLRDKIWATYRIGQEKNMTPSKQYIAVAKEAQDWIAAKLRKDKS
jgi:hypothetical protein